MKIKHYYLLIILVITSNIISAPCFADGQLVDKVYHPYVLANEREVEYRLYSRSTTAGNELAQRIGYGFSIAENIALESYIIGDRDIHGQFEFHAYEAELRWMLTDQGQYSIDSGMLFELERDTEHNSWEFTTGILLEKEFTKTSLTANGFLIYQHGDYLEQEVTAQLRIQYRYRYKSSLQPAIELYSDEDFTGIGPAFMGLNRFSPYKRLKWETAFIFGLNGKTKDNTFRFAIEYEF